MGSIIFLLKILLTVDSKKAFNFLERLWINSENTNYFVGFLSDILHKTSLEFHSDTLTVSTETP